MLHHLWIKSSRVRAQLSLYLLKPSNWPSLDWLSALFWRALSFQDCEDPTSLPRKVWKLLDKEIAILNVSPSFPSDWGLSSAWFRLRTLKKKKKATIATGNFKSEIFYFWIFWLQGAFAPMLINSKQQWSDWIIPRVRQSYTLLLQDFTGIHLFPSIKRTHF